MVDKEKILKHLDTMDRFPEDIDELEDDIKQGKFDFPVPKIKILEPETCRWKIDNDFSQSYELYYRTQCGHGFYISEGGLDISMKFCIFCGKPIEEVRGE